MASKPPADREGNSEYRAPRLQLSLADFDLERRLGEGSYAQVVQVRQKETGLRYALKVVDKSLVLRNKCTEYIKTERRLLDRLDSPWVVRLHFTFQDPYSLYFVLELCPHGELHEQLQRRGRLPMEDARFYAAEIVEILEYLRQQKVVHRDLKPENLLLEEQGHLKLIDFGSAKELHEASYTERRPSQDRSSLQHSQRTTFMVGTAEYLAPEVLRNEPVGYAADLWALGCLLYRMLLGKTPFAAASEYLIFERITSHDLHVPDTIAPAAQDLLKQLLDNEPRKRIGARSRGLSELREHPFFAGITWHNLRELKAPAVVQAARQVDDGIDWEWSSMAAALPVYISTDTASTQLQPATQPAAQSDHSHDMGPHHLHAGESSQSNRSAAAKQRLPKSALSGVLDQAGQISISDSKASASQQAGQYEKQANSPRPQQCAPAMQLHKAVNAHAESHSLQRSRAAAPAVAATQSKAPPGTVIGSPKQAGKLAPLACSPDRVPSDDLLSPKGNIHKSSAGKGYPGTHPKGGTVKIPGKSPPHKGDFLSHNSSPQAAWGGSMGGEDGMMQAASAMIMDQYFADAHSDGRT